MNLGFPEMIFLFLFALILFGPKKLPEIGRQIGRALNEFKRASNEFRSQIESEISQLDLGEHPPDHTAASPGTSGSGSFRQPAHGRVVGAGDSSEIRPEIPHPRCRTREFGTPPLAGQGARCLKWQPSFLPPKSRATV